MVLKLANLALLLLFPIAWFAPLLRAGLLPLFSLDEISVISGLQALWGSDVVLALLVTFFAIFAPYLKVIGLGLIQFRLASPRILPALHVLGKLAMADVFLVALYIVVVKGIGMGRVETGWGLYLFSGCVLAPLFEEGLYRGCLLRPLADRFGGWVAVFATSVLFALPHADLCRGTVPLLVGLALGGFQLRFRSLPFCIGYHAGLNSFVGFWSRGFELVSS